MKSTPHLGIISGLILLCLTLTGCYSVDGFVPSPEADARIVVYRRSSLNLALIGAYVSLDGATLVKLTNNDFVEIPIPSGEHRLVINANQFKRGDHRDIRLAPGETAYLEVTPNPVNAVAATTSALDPTHVGSGVIAVGQSATWLPFRIQVRTVVDFETAPSLRKVRLNGPKV